MTVSIAFAFIAGIIIIGFLANLFFRATKVPSVLLLIGIGVLLGPVTGLLTSDALIAIAPYFGTMALLIILFEGGLELDIVTVVRQAPTAAVLALLVFLFSFISVGAFAWFALNVSPLNAFLLASILGAGSPAIIIPLASGLSVRDDVKTVLKLESALGDVLLIVTVLVIIDVHASGSQSISGVAHGFFLSVAVAFAISTVAGALWSRLIGWMGKEPLAYMLTLGFLFLLYFVVEELHGSAALAILMFGLILENMHVIAKAIGPRLRSFFAVDVRAEQFVLHEFVKNITQELSFLVRTFFFVYLGLLLDFRSITMKTALYGVLIVALLVISRCAALRLIPKKLSLTLGESRVMMAMLPRGLATAVMAFLPLQQGIPGAEIFPVYAFMTIVLTNVLMTGGVILSERRIARERTAQQPIAVSAAAAPAAPVELRQCDEEVNPEPIRPSSSPQSAPAPPIRGSRSFTARTMRLLGIHSSDRERRYLHAIRASSPKPHLFWVQMAFATALTALGLVLDQSPIIIGAALIVPLAAPMLAAGLALAVGDIYLLIRLLVKLALAAALTIVLSLGFSELLPFNAVTSEIASRTRPTILDFLVALFAGMSCAALAFSRQRPLSYLSGVIVSLTLLPPLVVIGFGLGGEFSLEVLQGSALLFFANLFAALLGASLVYVAIGMPAVAANSSVAAWKQQELSQPLVQFLFERFKFGGIVGRAGSVHARLTVVFVFLLALIIPLQMAFNQLSLEFRTRQAIDQLKSMFNQPKRSTIMSLSSDIRDEGISVRIQVAVGDFFTASDIRRFEERMEDRTGIPTRLNLVQTLSDIDADGKISAKLMTPPPASSEYRHGLEDIVGDLRREVETAVLAADLPPTISILGAGTHLGMGVHDFSLEIDYMAPAPLSEDATILLTGLLRRQLKLTQPIDFTYIPTHYHLALQSGGISEGERTLQAIQATLARFPQLRADVRLPTGVPDNSSLRKELSRLAPSLSNPARAEFVDERALQEEISVILKRPASPGDAVQ